MGCFVVPVMPEWRCGYWPFPMSSILYWIQYFIRLGTHTSVWCGRRSHCYNDRPGTGGCFSITDFLVGLESNPAVLEGIHFKYQNITRSVSTFFGRYGTV